MSEVRIKPIRKLPEPLPEGERILWQQAPAWGPYSRRVFQVDKVAVYFLILLLWIAGSAALGDGGLAAALRAMTWAAPPSLGVLGVLALLAWLYARSTTYTITTRRVVIQSGLAVPAAINLPFTSIRKADMKAFRDGTGDIELSMNGQRLLYSMLWPNLRLLRLKNPVPKLLGLNQPKQVAEILGRALQESHQASSAVPAPERNRSEQNRSVTA